MWGGVVPRDWESAPDLKMGISRNHSVLAAQKGKRAGWVPRGLEGRK